MKFSILTILLSNLISKFVYSEEVTLRCDELERMYDLLPGATTNEPYCTVSGFIVSHSQTVKIQKHVRANNFTKYMKFYDSKLLYIPYKLFDVFTNLKTLDVSSTEILDVPRNTFGAASSLTYVNMSNNNITKLTTSVFVGANSLMRLDLSHNKISEINEFAFQGLIQLNKLQLSFNLLAQLNADVFAENPYIESISLDNNFLSFIAPEVFTHLRRIRDVNLSNNLLLRLHPATFQSAYGLESLHLSNNNLTQFELTNKSIAQHLNLDNNYLTSLTVNGSKFVKADHNRINTIYMVNALHLESLELSYNNISDIANITSLSGLTLLNLSYNNITNLNISTFDNLKRLKNLRLAATNLRSLTFGMFSKLTSLAILDLSYNNLSAINLDIFVPYLSNLIIFYVDGNNLTEFVGYSTFSTAFPSLQQLGISRNSFNCSYLHVLLTSLSDSVALHIEYDGSPEERTHIRDIACVSHNEQQILETKKRIHNLKTLEELMIESLNTINAQDQRLHNYLLIVKITFFTILSMAAIGLVFRIWRYKRHGYFNRNVGIIAYNSSATVTTAMDA